MNGLLKKFQSNNKFCIYTILVPTLWQVFAMASSPPEPTMWLSTRKRFDNSDPGWDEFTAFIGLPHLIEARSVDSSLNECVDGNRSLFDVAELWSTLDGLTPAKQDIEYHLLFVDAVQHPNIRHEGLTFLGYDLSDETWTSSVLNCGKWDGPLKCLADTIQSNGLLTWDAANTAQAILPGEWDKDPHSFVTIWALYEVTRPERDA